MKPNLVTCRKGCFLFLCHKHSRTRGRISLRPLKVSCLAPHFSHRSLKLVAMWFDLDLSQSSPPLCHSCMLMRGIRRSWAPKNGFNNMMNSYSFTFDFIKDMPTYKTLISRHSLVTQGKSIGLTESVGECDRGKRRGNVNRHVIQGGMSKRGSKGEKGML